MALWPAPRGRMDDWSISAETRAAASGQAPNPAKSVTLTQARFFMDDGTWPVEGPLRLLSNADACDLRRRRCVPRRCSCVSLPRTRGSG